MSAALPIRTAEAYLPLRKVVLYKHDSGYLERCGQWMSALANAKDKQTEIRGRVDEGGTKVLALEEQIAAKIRAYSE